MKATFCLLVALVLPVLAAAPPTAPAIPAAAQPSAHFDAAAATNAWLATVPAPSRLKSDAYFEGGYWLMLWDFLYGAAVMLLLLETRASARMRTFAERVTRVRAIHSFLYWTGFVILASLLTFPLTLYEGFFREHAYNLSNQSFASWFRDALIGLVLAVILGGIAFPVLVAIVRRLPRSWHLWGTAVSVLFLIIGTAITPVFVSPLFNTYKPLQNTVIKAEILSLAHANGISVRDVYEVDASRQSKRVSANVSGILGTERITLNDNLLNRCSPQAILAVMGHEMGHYVMHHILNSILFGAIGIALLFGILRGALGVAVSRWGTRWQINSIDDLAILPFAVLILSTLGFLFTPIDNTYTRVQEYEADIFGLNASRQPDGEAEADLLLGEYRKLDPTPLEEFIFYDHPSGRTRIFAAMRWKAENLCLFDRSLPCASQPVQ